MLRVQHGTFRSKCMRNWEDWESVHPLERPTLRLQFPKLEQAERAAKEAMKSIEQTSPSSCLVEISGHAAPAP